MIRLMVCVNVNTEVECNK